MAKLISIVVPVYGSEEILPLLYKRLKKVFLLIQYDFELIFIDDCGPDNCWDVICNISNSDERVKGFRMSRNYSQHNATLCGIRKATGEIIITMDDDLQHPPEVLPTLIESLNTGYDLIYGPPLRNQHSPIRNLITDLAKYFLEFPMGTNNARYISSLRVFHSDLRNAFSDFNSEVVNVDFLLSYATNNVGITKVQHETRLKGSSGYSLKSLIRHTLTIITSYSTKPLRISTYIGMSMACFGLVIFVYVLLKWFQEGSDVPGFAFLASIISIFSGSQLLALGIIGEYISHMHKSSLNRPSYCIRTATKKIYMKKNL